MVEYNNKAWSFRINEVGDMVMSGMVSWNKLEWGYKKSIVTEGYTDSLLSYLRAIESILSLRNAEVRALQEVGKHVPRLQSQDLKTSIDQICQWYHEEGVKYYDEVIAVPNTSCLEVLGRVATAYQRTLNLLLDRLSTVGPESLDDAVEGLISWVADGPGRLHLRKQELSCYQPHKFEADFRRRMEYNLERAVS